MFVLAIILHPALGFASALPSVKIAGQIQWLATSLIINTTVHDEQIGEWCMNGNMDDGVDWLNILQGFGFERVRKHDV